MRPPRTSPGSGRPGALTPAEQEGLFYAPCLNQSVHRFNVGAWFGPRAPAAAEALGELIGLVASGQVRVPLGTRLPLSAAAEAHRRLEDRSSEAKIVLKPWE